MPTDPQRGGDDEHAVDAARIAMLLMRHRAALYGYVYSCLRHHADAEDVFQDLCSVAIRSAGKLRSEDGFRPWVFEIARRTVLEALRQRSRHIVADPDLVQLLAVTHHDSSLEQQRYRVQALQQCLERLSDMNRHIIQMRYADGGQDVQAIASDIGRSVSATYGLLKRVRMTLRACVERRLASQDHQA